MKEIKDLLNWRPKGEIDLKSISKVNHGKYFKYSYTDEDKDQPFFSEAYLYNLLGKESARTLLGLMERVCKEVTGKTINEIQEEKKK